MALGGALLGGLCLTWLLYEQLLHTKGKIGFFLFWYLTFVALYGVITRLGNPRTVVTDRLVGAVIVGAAAFVGLALVTAIGFTFIKGWPALHHANFYTQDSAKVGPTTPLNVGGIKHAIFGSAIQIGLATVIALPLGIATAVYMTEVGGRLARVVRTVVEAMTALPEIVAGLFVYATLVVSLGQERSGFAAAMAITIMMIPIIARSSEVVLRVVPGGLRQASLALGGSMARTVWSVVLPTARSGLATALILGIARGVGETAPVLLTSGASNFFNSDPFHNPMNSLPLFIYFGVRGGQDLQIQRGFGAAAVLLALVLALFVITRALARGRRR